MPFHLGPFRCMNFLESDYKRCLLRDVSAFQGAGSCVCINAASRKHHVLKRALTYTRAAEWNPYLQHIRKAPVTSRDAAWVCVGWRSALEWGLCNVSKELANEAILPLMETHCRFITHSKENVTEMRNPGTRLCVSRTTLPLCFIDGCIVRYNIFAYELRGAAVF